MEKWKAKRNGIVGEDIKGKFVNLENHRLEEWVGQTHQPDTLENGFRNRILIKGILLVSRLQFGMLPAAGASPFSYAVSPRARQNRYGGGI